MLNILHRQTTAYHPESNGAVERLHRCLKDALCTRANAATWSEDLPFVLLGLRAQPREDNGLSLAEVVFGTPIVLPNEFLQTEEISVDSIINNVSKTLDAPASSLPRHNSSVQLPSELPAELLFAPPPHLGPSWRRGPTSPAALQWPLRCSAPWPLLLHHPSRITGQGHCRQPPQGLHGSRRRAWQAASLRQSAGSCPGGLATTKGSRFHLLLRRCHETVPEPFSYLERRFLHAWDRQRLRSLHRRGTRPVNC